MDDVEATQLRLLVFDDARGREERGFIAYILMQSEVGNAANYFTDFENFLKGTKVLTQNIFKLVRRYDDFSKLHEIFV